MKSKIKSIKTGKELGTTYCLGCEDVTHNFRPQQAKMVSQVLREKSIVFFVDPVSQDFKNKNKTHKISFHK